MVMLRIRRWNSETNESSSTVSEKITSNELVRLDFLFSPLMNEEMPKVEEQ